MAPGTLRRNARAMWGDVDGEYRFDTAYPAFHVTNEGSQRRLKAHRPAKAPWRLHPRSALLKMDLTP